MPSFLEVFQDLHISAQESTRTALAVALVFHAKAPWRHISNAPAEQQKQGDIILMERSETEGIPAVRIMLWPTEVSYIVSNVVPTEVGSLTTALYNKILQEFSQLVAEPAVISVGGSLSLSSPNQSIAEWFDASTVQAFTRFSDLANKSTGASHPSDATRWKAFVINAHLSGRKIDTDLFFRWLFEIEHFPEEIAHDLASVYDFSRDLLQQYDETH